MSLWLLLEDFSDRKGQALELHPAALKPGGSPRPFTLGPEGELFDIDLFWEQDSNDGDSQAVVAGDLQLSANKGGQLAYKLLYEEGYVREEASARFQLAKTSNVSGYSADLLFAIAVVTVAVPRIEGYPPLAATGTLDNDGRIQKVQGVSAKLKAALAVMHTGGLFFYPRVNDEVIDSKLRIEAQQVGVELIAVENLDEAVSKLGTELKRSWRGNPYRGLGVFNAKHSRIFFGRQSDVSTLVAKLLKRESAGNPGVLIIGSSGRGKSSLVQAGLLPYLERHFIDRPVFYALWRPSETENHDAEEIANRLRDQWVLLTELATLSGMQQGDDVLSAEEVIIRKTLNQAQPITTSLDKASNDCPLATLAKDLATVLPKNRRFIYVIDQMEEIFSPEFSHQTRQAFGAFLLQLQHLGVWVIATLRSEYFHDYQQSNLLEVFGDGYTLPPLNATALERVIRKPAELRKLRFEVYSENGHELALQIRDDALNEGGDNLLPLLQFTLSELYKHRDQEKGMLTYGAYLEIGGLQGGISRYANQLLSACSKAELKVLPEVLVHLISLSENGTRVIRKRAQLKRFSNDAAQNSMVNKLIEARLLTSDDISSVDTEIQGSVVELVHDCLLTVWKPAVQVIEDYREILDQRHKLITSSLHWNMDGKRKNLLIKNTQQLIKAEAIYDNYIGDISEKNQIQLFLQASIRNTRGKNKWIWLLVCLQICFMTIGVLSDYYTTKINIGNIKIEIDEYSPRLIYLLILVLIVIKTWSVFYPKSFFRTARRDLIFNYAALIITFIFIISFQTKINLLLVNKIWLTIPLFLILYIIATSILEKHFLLSIKDNIGTLKTFHGNDFYTKFAYPRNFATGFFGIFFKVFIVLSTVYFLSLGADVLKLNQQKAQFFNLATSYLSESKYYFEKNKTNIAIKTLNKSYDFLALSDLTHKWRKHQHSAEQYIDFLIISCNLSIKLNYNNFNNCKTAVKVSKYWINKTDIVSRQKWINKLANSLNTIGFSLVLESEYIEALQILEHAKSQLENRVIKFKNDPYNNILAQIEKNIGTSHRKNGNIDLALIHYSKARELFENLINESPENQKHASELLNLYNNIANINKQTHDSIARLEVLLSAEALLNKLKQSQLQGFWGNSQLENIQAELSNMSHN